MSRQPDVDCSHGTNPNTLRGWERFTILPTPLCPGKHLTSEPPANFGGWRATPDTLWESNG
jgi:hypothetical protein